MPFFEVNRRSAFRRKKQACCFLLDAYPVQCEISQWGRRRKRLPLVKKAPQFLDQEALFLFIGLMSAAEFAPPPAGPCLVTPASHYSARVTSRAPPGKVKPPPLTRTQTKTLILWRDIAFASFCWRDYKRYRSDAANQLYAKSKSTNREGYNR